MNFFADNLPALIDYNKIENEQCSLTSEKLIRTVDFRISPSVSNGTPALLIETGIRVGILLFLFCPLPSLNVVYFTFQGPETIGYFQFIKDGWSRENDKPSVLPKEQIHAQGVTINPLTDAEKPAQVPNMKNILFFFYLILFV